MSHKSASFQQILAPLELEPWLRRGKNACMTQSACVQGGERDGWGSSPGVSLDSIGGMAVAGGASHFGGAARAAEYEAADQGSVSFRNIQAAFLLRWGQLEVLASRPHGRGSMRRGAGSGDRPLILFEGVTFYFENVTLLF